MTRIQDALRALVAPHQHAERLLDARLDARRGEGALHPDDEAWLDAHLDACADCQKAARARKEAQDILLAVPGLSAPDGFLQRVLASAQEEARADAGPARLEPVRRPTFQWAFAGAAMAATVLFAFALTTRAPSGGAPAVEVSGTAASGPEAVDFDVRAPGLGAAEVRAVVSRIASGHAGQIDASGGHLSVRIPRAELVGMLRDLSRAGEVSVTPRRELDPDRETVVLRVNLD